MDNLTRTDNLNSEEVPAVNNAPDPTLKLVNKAEKPEKPKKRTKAAKPRTIEELDYLAPKAMSEPEKIKYIEYLRTELVDQAGKIKMLEHNCDQAYEKVRCIEQNFADYKNQARAKLHFAKQAVSTCHNSLVIMGNLEG
jgi:hypothetical protein